MAIKQMKNQSPTLFCSFIREVTALTVCSQTSPELSLPSHHTLSPNFTCNHILPIIGACVCPEALLIVTQYMPAGSLHHLLYHSHPGAAKSGSHGSTTGARVRAGAGGLTEYCKLLFAYEVSFAIHNLHSKKYIHRDVTTSNILIFTHPVHGEHAYLADFGLARSKDETLLSRHSCSNSSTSGSGSGGGSAGGCGSNSINSDEEEMQDSGEDEDEFEEGCYSPIGHPRYCAPEVSRKEPYSFKADIFMLGNGNNTHSHKITKKQHKKLQKTHKKKNTTSRNTQCTRHRDISLRSFGVLFLFIFVCCLLFVVCCSAL